MKSLATLHLAVLHDVGRFCDVDVRLDERTLIQRTEHEGDSFLTITLPAISKALEKGLHDGQWPRQDMTILHHVRGLPAFMRGFLTRVFNDDGGILDEPDANAIWAVRQFCNLSAKIERECTPARVNAAFNSFITTDRELGTHFRELDVPELWRRFDSVSLALFGDLFDKLETLVASFQLIPRHGPGAVADRLDHAQRWDFSYWPERLESVFPAWRYTVNVPRSYERATIPLGSELPVRVVSVPKTQKTPRIIAIEPSSVQYAQQGLKREIYTLVRKSSLNDILGFQEQDRNQHLAYSGSVDGSLATLDLSEASDRVHLSVVIRLLKRWPHLRDFVLATRSRTALVNGEEIHLNKFASMGSALTFPIETMIFTVIAFMGQSSSSIPSVRSQIGRISVYGDDIIVPTDSAADVVQLLETFGFKVNKHKSFWKGYFRESCGKEYYHGHDVSVVRLRSEVPTSRQDASLINRFTDFRNRAYRAGLWGTVKVCDDMIFRVIRPPYRHLDEQENHPIGVIAFDTVLRTKWRAHYNESLQIYEERYPRAVPLTTSYEVVGEAGLLKWFQENHNSNDLYQRDRYEGQERAHTFRIKWAKAERFPKQL